MSNYTYYTSELQGCVSVEVIFRAQQRGGKQTEDRIPLTREQYETILQLIQNEITSEEAGECRAFLIELLCTLDI